jgi:formate hydrogenlyase subunit 3/multisubunit Na+/H+ antiporter MnhD subunit
MAGIDDRLPRHRLDTMTVLCLLLFIGAMGKSAQLPLHTWLPDAMEGPTPVSALIHAATMVTAGVFMVCRLSPMFEYVAETALHVVTYHRRDHLRSSPPPSALVQNDIKRVIAYSTCRSSATCSSRWRRRLWRGDVPPVHARLLQGAAVPRRGLGHPRDAPRAGHALLWRAA